MVEQQAQEPPGGGEHGQTASLATSLNPWAIQGKGSWKPKRPQVVYGAAMGLGQLPASGIIEEVSDMEPVTVPGCQRGIKEVPRPFLEPQG